MSLILLRDVELYAPESRGRGDLLVAGGRIAQVGGSLSAPSGWPCEVVECGGARVIPGLVDVHAHLSGGGGEGGAHTRVPAVPFSAFTLAGVTTAVGLLGTDATTRGLPELLAAARALETLGLTTFTYTGAYEVPVPTVTGSVRGDLVHIDRMIAVGELAISDHRSSQPTFDEVARICADAHVAGLMTGKAGLVHFHLGDGPRGLSLIRQLIEQTELPTRTFHPTHLNRNPDLWAEAMAMGASHQLRGDVTAFPAGDPAPSASACVAAWIEAGNPPEHLTCSSDGGGCLPEFDSDGQLTHMGVGQPSTLLQTVRELLDLGMDLSTALGPVTRHPADLFRLPTKGRLAPDADADLVVLDSSLTPSLVMASGRVLVRNGRPEVLGPFEAP